MAAVRVSARRVAWLVVAAGLCVGWNATPSSRAAPARYGSGVILAADFHVHSFPGDGSLAPWDLAVEADRRGLDAIALTNHNHRLSWRLTQRLPLATHGALLIPGEELTAMAFHIAAVGSREDVSWRQGAAAAVRAIHAQGGVAIAAHPAGSDAEAFDDAAIDVLDGVEAAHPLAYVVADGRRDLTAFYQRAKVRCPAIAAIGSTDFHFFAPVGFCRTFVFASERSTPAIVEAIRRGAPSPAMPAGRRSVRRTSRLSSPRRAGPPRVRRRGSGRGRIPRVRRSYGWACSRSSSSAPQSLT